MNTQNLSVSLTTVILLFAQFASADSTLEFLVQDSRTASGKPQPVLIKDGQLLVKGAGGDDKLDLLYNRTNERLTIIDHRKKTIMPVDEKQVQRITEQTENFMPLLQGLSEQAARLSPEQRSKWEQMLGGKVSLDKLAEASKPRKAPSVVKTGSGKSVAGFRCEEMNVVQGKATMAQVCLAAPETLNLSKDDYATIRSLFKFSGDLAEKTHGFAEHFGVKVPRINVRDFAGVPLEMHDLSGKRQGSVTLSRIVTSAVSEDLMRVPQDYRTETLQLWK